MLLRGFSIEISLVPKIAFSFRSYYLPVFSSASQFAAAEKKNKCMGSIDITKWIFPSLKKSFSPTRIIYLTCSSTTSILAPFSMDSSCAGLWVLARFCESDGSVEAPGEPLKVKSSALSHWSAARRIYNTNIRVVGDGAPLTRTAPFFYFIHKIEDTHTMHSGSRAPQRANTAKG